MMQAFYWNVPVDVLGKNGTWWDNLSSKAAELKECGVTALWTPVPSKGNWGIMDNGYGVFDHYDLGNYNQKGSVETRFGSRDELVRMITEMHREPRIDVYSDVVLNHIYSSFDEAEPNPIVKSYIFSEAKTNSKSPFPCDEVTWIVPDAPAGDYRVYIKGYCLPELSAILMNGYELSVSWGEDVSGEYIWEEDIFNKDNTYLLGKSGLTVRGNVGHRDEIDVYSFTIGQIHDIVIRLTAKTGSKSSGIWTDAGKTVGYYPVWILCNDCDMTSDLLAYTNTAISYVDHTGCNEPSYTWDYTHFHPSSHDDWLGAYTGDAVEPNTRFFGNDLDTFNPVVRKRLCDWGDWLLNSIGFDGFRLDFVRGFQEEFVAEWVNGLSMKNIFIVGEYWGGTNRIKNWVSKVDALGAKVKAFDFPLKFTLTDMCNSAGDDFDMSLLNHAGLIRNNTGDCLPEASVVTFVENHDTGKEHDKWVLKDIHLAYAYILTHPGRPCIFYPHFFEHAIFDAEDSSKTVLIPHDLKGRIQRLIDIRRRYLGGDLSVLSETGCPFPLKCCENLYIARRGGNNNTDGAVIVINNADSETVSMQVCVNCTGMSDLTNRTLINILNPAEKTIVDDSGRAMFAAAPRDYSIWIPEENL